MCVKKVEITDSKPSFQNANIAIILGTAHLKSTPGKCSPDGSFKEYEYSRYICKEVQKKLTDLGYRCIIDCLDDEIPYKELEYRVSIVNKLCKQYENCLYVSIHNNAAGSGKEWKNAQGWSVFIYRKASEKSRKLAEYLFDECKGLKTRKETPSRKYWESGLYVCKNTNCPAVLTENFFFIVKLNSKLSPKSSITIILYLIFLPKQ